MLYFYSKSKTDCICKQYINLNKLKITPKIVFKYLLHIGDTASPLNMHQVEKDNISLTLKSVIIDSILLLISINLIKFYLILILEGKNMYVEIYFKFSGPRWITPGLLFTKLQSKFIFESHPSYFSFICTGIVVFFSIFPLNLY